MSEIIHLVLMCLWALGLLWDSTLDWSARKFSSLVADADIFPMLPCRPVSVDVCAPYVVGFNEQSERQSGILDWRQFAGEIEFFGWREVAVYAF